MKTNKSKMTRVTTIIAAVAGSYVAVACYTGSADWCRNMLSPSPPQNNLYIHNGESGPCDIDANITADDTVMWNLSSGASGYYVKGITDCGVAYICSQGPGNPPLNALVSFNLPGGQLYYQSTGFCQPGGS